MKVLITSNSFGSYNPAPRQQMLDLGWELIDNRYHHIMNEEEMMEEVHDVDAIILGSDIVSKRVLDNAKKLKIISRYGVGIDNIDCAYAKEKGIEVTVTKNCNTEAVADYAIGLMLAVSRHICNVNYEMHQGNWVKATGLDVCHKTVGVFGLGAIGRQVIARLQGFGCHILGYDAFVDEAYVKEHNIELVQPEEIFQRADVITLHMPGSVDGTHFINKKELDMMKPTCIVINTARASLVNEIDMIDALRNNKLYGYGSDVFDGEPHMNPSFQELPNAVLSPHNAAVSEEAVNNMSQVAVDHLITFFKEH